MSRLLHRSLILLKLSIALSLLWLTFRNVDLLNLSVKVHHARIDCLLLAIALQFAAYFFGSLRWWLMLAHSERSISFGAIQRPYHLGLFFNQFLPSSVGGDAVRIAALYKQGVTGRSLVSSSLMDRIIGLIVLLWLGLIAINIGRVIDFPDGVRRGILVCAVVVPFCGVGLFLPATESLLKLFWSTQRLGRLRSLAVNVLQTCRSYGKSPRLVVQLVITSLLLQLSATAVYFALGIGLGIKIHFFTYIAIVSVVYFSASIPISVGGLGVRENVFVTLMVLTGASSQNSAALAVLFLFVLWISVLPGLLLFLRNRGGSIVNEPNGPPNDESQCPSTVDVPRNSRIPVTSGADSAPLAIGDSPEP